MNFPTQYKYTRDHEWAHIQGDTATIGITEHAQSSLGDIVFVDLPKLGRRLKSHETFGVVESIKAVSDLYAPLPGEVTEVNTAVVHDPGLVNRSSQDSAWLIKLKLSAEGHAALGDLLDAEAYSNYVQSLK